MYNYGYRYLNPELGRWLSRDPIGEQGGINLYGFAANDGVSRIDILGKKLGDEFGDFSNCLGYGLTGLPRYCLWPNENESLENYIKKISPDADCDIVDSSKDCGTKKDHARTLIYFYKPHLYHGDPWSDPQGWVSVPGIDIHAMNSGCNKKEWKHVLGKKPNPPPIGDVDPTKWDKRKVKVVCCYRPCNKKRKLNACLDDSNSDTSLV